MSTIGSGQDDRARSTPSGRLFVVGLGPGEQAIMTGQAQAALSQADVVIGYTGYFAYIEALITGLGKECLALPLTQEIERAQLAVNRAEQGHTVCVICSGDAGIYGMASLVLDLVAQRQKRQTEAPLPDVVVVPGVSAVNACAALLGAPIGHDFAVISLSDLLTPWAVIEPRLTACAIADFVTVLLNPKSARRGWQYGRAQAILARHRAPDTPVGVVRNAYRPDQSVIVTSLESMATATVDMFTTVIVGNSQTRVSSVLRGGHGWQQTRHVWQSYMLTPRGYTAHASR